MKLNDINNKTAIELIFKFNDGILSNKNSILFPLDYSIKLPKKPNDIIIKEIEDMKSYAQSITQSSMASVFGASLISADPSTFFTFLNTAEIFSYVVLFNNNFDPLLVAFLNALKPSSMIPNIFEKVISKDNGNKLDKKYQEFGMDTNLILLNTGVYYMFLSLLVFMSLGTLALSYIKNGIVVRFTRYCKSFLFFKAFLRLWIQSCLEVTIAAILGIFEGRVESIYSFFDYGLCILTLV